MALTDREHDELAAAHLERLASKAEGRALGSGRHGNELRADAVTLRAAASGLRAGLHRDEPVVAPESIGDA